MKSRDLVALLGSSKVKPQVIGQWVVGVWRYKPGDKCVHQTKGRAVEHADYAAILSSKEARYFWSASPPQRRTLVSSLTGKHFAFLDSFEGAYLTLILVYHMSDICLLFRDRNMFIWRCSYILLGHSDFATTSRAAEDGLILLISRASYRASTSCTSSNLCDGNVKGLDSELWSFENFVWKNASG